MSEPKEVEELARKFCRKDGHNPDLTLGGDGQNFRWHEYISKARAQLIAMEIFLRPAPASRTAADEGAGE